MYMESTTVSHKSFHVKLQIIVLMSSICLHITMRRFRYIQHNTWQSLSWSPVYGTPMIVAQFNGSNEITIV